MNIGKAIKIIRKKASLTQGDLARKCSISQTSLSQIENGVKKPRAKTFNSLCQVLDVPESVIYILALEDKDVPPHRKMVYELLFPSITAMALQIAGPQYMDYSSITTAEILPNLEELEVLN
jgi:XRE family transcriptional regulator, regulator of sulfur utilization